MWQHLVVSATTTFLPQYALHELVLLVNWNPKTDIAFLVFQLLLDALLSCFYELQLCKDHALHSQYQQLGLAVAWTAIQGT
jgi:hypothetical protein